MEITQHDKTRQQQKEWARRNRPEHPEKVKEYKRKYYERNKEKIRIQGKKWADAHRDKCRISSKKYHDKNGEKCRKYQTNQNQIRQNFLNELKKNGCNVCGYNKCLAALEFHHRDSKEKERLVSRIATIEGIKKEALKCIVICSNCHKEIHYIYRFRRN